MIVHESTLLKVNFANMKNVTAGNDAAASNLCAANCRESGFVIGRASGLQA